MSAYREELKKVYDDFFDSIGVEVVFSGGIGDRKEERISINLTDSEMNKLSENVHKAYSMVAYEYDSYDDIYVKEYLRNKVVVINKESLKNRKEDSYEKIRRIIYILKEDESHRYTNFRNVKKNMRKAVDEYFNVLEGKYDIIKKSLDLKFDVIDFIRENTIGSLAEELRLKGFEVTENEEGLVVDYINKLNLNKKGSIRIKNTEDGVFLDKEYNKFTLEVDNKYNIKELEERSEELKNELIKKGIVIV